MKGAQCSEVVKSGVPSIWFLWKSQDFLVTQEQKLRTMGHQALLQHSLDYYYNFLLLNWYLLGVEMNLRHAYKTRFWYLLGLMFSKFSNEHPRHFFMGIPPRLSPLESQEVLSFRRKDCNHLACKIKSPLIS